MQSVNENQNLEYVAGVLPNDYELLEYVGAGAYGQVFKARSKVTG